VALSLNSNGNQNKAVYVHLWMVLKTYTELSPHVMLRNLI
jgi:hypothetical protein